MELELTIKRIKEMENIFNQVLHHIKENPDLDEGISFWNLAHRLKDYYESDQWLKDYEADERGELPVDLKRGVLSQDGIYNLLLEIEQRGGILDGK